MDKISRIKGAFRFLMTKTFAGDDGKIHFVSSASPEFTNGVEDASYTISAAKWLARTIISSVKDLEFPMKCAMTVSIFSTMS